MIAGGGSRMAEDFSTTDLSTCSSWTSDSTDLPVDKEDAQCQTNITIARKCCSRHVCPRALAKYRELVRAREEETEKKDNFIFVGARYIENVCQWTRSYIYGRLLADDFLRSVIASVALFAIGMKLTGELVAWNLPMFVK